MGLKLTMEVSSRRIADMMVGAMEQNSMTKAWVAAVRLRSPTEDDLYMRTKNHNWYDVPELWEGEFAIDLWEIEDESKYGGFDPENDEEATDEYLAANGLKKRTFTRDDLEKGIALMARDHGAHFADMVQENDDNITHDVFLQCIVLKDVVYG